MEEQNLNPPSTNNPNQTSPESSKIKLYVATPCFGGMVTHNYLQGVLGLERECQKRNILLKVLTFGNESLITRARNLCVSKFLDAPENYTHLLFIDADIGFSPENVFRLLDFDKEFCSGIYPRKNVDFARLVKAFEEGVRDPWELEAKSLDYNISVIDPQKVTLEKGSFVEVKEVAAGFMLLKREVLLKMIQAYPELSYKSDSFFTSGKYDSQSTYLLFDCIKDPETERYLSEDYTFCKRWRALGGKIYADIGASLTHVGTFRFKGH